MSQPAPLPSPSDQKLLNKSWGAFQAGVSLEQGLEGVARALADELGSGPHAPDDVARLYAVFWGRLKISPEFWEWLKISREFWEWLKNSQVVFDPAVTEHIDWVRGRHTGVSAVQTGPSSAGLGGGASAAGSGQGVEPAPQGERRPWSNPAVRPGAAGGIALGSPVLGGTGMASQPGGPATSSAPGAPPAAGAAASQALPPQAVLAPGVRTGNLPATRPAVPVAPVDPKQSVPAKAANPSAPPALKAVVLPNGRVGDAYHVSLKDHAGDAVRALLSAPGAYVQIEGLQGTGLRFDAETQVLDGILSSAGDVDLRLRMSRKLDEVPVRLCVTADPRTLWTNKPSDPAAEYAKPDQDRAMQDVPGEGGRVAVAASQRGRSHAHEGKFREDHFTVGSTECGWLIAVVADGQGSAPFSRAGSRMACETVRDELLARLPKVLGDERFLKGLAAMRDAGAPREDKVTHPLYEALGGAFLEASKRVAEEAAARGRKAKEYGTTLLALAANHLPGLGWFLASCSVGDGGIGIYVQPQQGEKPSDSCVHVISANDSGKYGGETKFLQSLDFKDHADIMNRIKYKLVDRFTAVVLMTDGITDPKFETEQRLENAAAWDAFWSDLVAQVDLKAPDADARLLTYLDFWSPGNHDDRTIAVIS